MGCLDVKLNRIGDTNVNAFSTSGFFDVNCSASNGMDVSFFRYNLIQSVNAYSVCFIVRAERTNKMSVRCGLVCSLDYANELNIEPKHIWLMPENLFTNSVCVYTEVVWHVN